MTERPGRGNRFPRLPVSNAKGLAVNWVLLGYKVTGIAPGEELPKMYAACNSPTEAQRLADMAEADGWRLVTWQTIYGRKPE